MDQNKVKFMVLKLVGDVGYLLDEAELITGTSGEVDEYVVSAETFEDLRQAFIALKKEIA